MTKTLPAQPSLVFPRFWRIARGISRFGTQRAGLCSLIAHKTDSSVTAIIPPTPTVSRAMPSTLSSKTGKEVCWASVVDLSVTRFETTPPSFQKLPRSLGEPHAFGEPFISAIYQDRKEPSGLAPTGNRYIGMDLQTGEHTTYPYGEGAVAPDIICITDDRSGRLLGGHVQPRVLLFRSKQPAL